MLHKKRGLEYSPKLLPSLLSISLRETFILSSNILLFLYGQVVKSRGRITQGSHNISGADPENLERGNWETCQLQYHFIHWLQNSDRIFVFKD